jgi:acyl-CoA thioester hydrolase
VKPHLTEAARTRVLFADTDAMGVVYHSVYLRWFEQGRCEMLRRTGLSYRALVDRDLHLPLTEALVRYHRPARYDDELVILTGVEEVKGVRLSLVYEIRKDGDLLVGGHTRHAFTDATGKVVRPPADVVEALRRLA